MDDAVKRAVRRLKRRSRKPPDTRTNDDVVEYRVPGVRYKTHAV